MIVNLNDSDEDAAVIFVSETAGQETSHFANHLPKPEPTFINPDEQRYDPNTFFDDLGENDNQIDSNFNASDLVEIIEDPDMDIEKVFYLELIVK